MSASSSAHFACGRYPLKGWQAISRSCITPARDDSCWRAIRLLPPLYYWCDGKTLVFDRDQSHPRASRRPRRAERGSAGGFPAARSAPYEDEGDTFFRGIRAVLPGCAVSVSARGIHSPVLGFRPQINALRLMPARRSAARVADSGRETAASPNERSPSR
jgi:hypothetical protein